MSQGAPQPRLPRRQMRPDGNDSASNRRPDPREVPTRPPAPGVGIGVRLNGRRPASTSRSKPRPTRTRRQAETIRTSLSARLPEQKVAVWSADAGGMLTPGTLEIASAAREQELERVTSVSEPAPPRPEERAEAGGAIKEQVALRGARTDDEVRQRSRLERSDRGGVASETTARAPSTAGNLAGGAAAAPAAPADQAGRQRFSQQPSSRPVRGSDATAGAGRGYRRSAERAQAGVDIQVKAKADEAEPAPSRQLSEARAPAASEAPSVRANTGRAIRPQDAPAATDNLEANAGEILAEQNGAPGQQPESAAPPAPVARATEAQASAVPSGPADAGEERVDLVILVKAPDDAEVGSVAGTIEKHEILTVTIGDTDPTNVRVAEDGTIDLPPAGRVAAEGLTADALGKRIAESLGRTGGGAGVTVTRLGPTTAAGAAATPANEPGAAEPESQPADAGAVPDGATEPPSSIAPEPLPIPPDH